MFKLRFKRCSVESICECLKVINVDEVEGIAIDIQELHYSDTNQLKMLSKELENGKKNKIQIEVLIMNGENNLNLLDINTLND